MLVHTFDIDFNWLILNKLSQLERFTGQWAGMIMSEGYGLKQLKSVATVSSTGASTRMDGSKLTDEDIEDLMEHLDPEKMRGRDQQLVAGYIETLDLIAEAWQDIPVSESSIRSLQNVLVKYIDQEEPYTPDEVMRKLVEWYKKDKEVHPLIRIAVFIYVFLNRTGKGCISRLTTCLLLLKEGYSWIEYISLDHELELRHREYNQVLLEARPNAWIVFFLDCLVHVQQRLIQKLETKIEDISISPRVQQIRMYVEHHGGVRTGEIAENLGIPLPTVKKEVTAMVAAGWLVRHGSGAGTNYTAKPRLMAQPDRMLKLGSDHVVTTFQITQPRIIKQVVLTPLFNWTQPDEWMNKLVAQGLYLRIDCINQKGVAGSGQYLLAGFNHAYLFQPVFTFKHPIVIPDSVMERTIYKYEYPWEVRLSLEGSVPVEDYVFDVLVVYGEKE